MPGDVNVAGPIGCHTTAAVERLGGLHQVALFLECCARVVEPSVEHGRAVLAGAAWLSLARAIPGDMRAAILAHGKLTAADRADGDRAAGLAVHANRSGERCLAWPSADVE